MDRLKDVLEDLRDKGIAQGNFLGMLNVLIGRRIQAADGTVLLQGVTWRQLAAALKRVRWDKDAVQELGLNPDDLPPRDRERYWYSAIAQARVDSDAATQAGNACAQRMSQSGYQVGPPPKKS